MIFIDTRCILAKKTAGLYIIEFPPVGGRKKSKGLEVGKEIKGEKKREKKKENWGKIQLLTVPND